MHLKRIGIATAAAALAVGGAGTASANQGKPPGQGNCLATMVQGGQFGDFVRPIATSGPGAFGVVGRSIASDGGASFVSNPDCRPQ